MHALWCYEVCAAWDQGLLGRRLALLVLEHAVVGVWLVELCGLGCVTGLWICEGGRKGREGKG